MMDYESYKCVHFIPNLDKKEDTDYLYYTDLGGCWSYVGKNGGKQPISLGEGCKTKGKVRFHILIRNTLLSQLFNNHLGNA